MQLIIAMSGRKQAGKNTIGDFVANYYATKKLNQSSIAIGNSKNPFLKDVMLCSFADALKDFCIDVLGVSYESCYGTDEQKNQPTEYLWENASPFLAWKFGKRLVSFSDGYPNKDLSNYHLYDSEKLRQIYYENISRGHSVYGHKTGAMTARDIMQIIGTDLMRETFGNIWAKATILKIKKSKVSFAGITDLRFPNEIKAVIQEPNGYVIRLTRSPFGTNDVHPSESALDNYKWDQEKHFILDNINMTMEEQNKAVVPILENIFSQAGI